MLRTFVFENLITSGPPTESSFFQAPTLDPLLVLTEPYFPKPAYNESDLNERYQMGYVQGCADGKKEMMNSLENAIASATTQLVQKLPEFIERLQRDHEVSQKTLFSVMRMVVTKVFQSHIAEQAASEIEAALKHSVSFAYQSPYIRLYVNNKLLKEVEDKLKPTLNDLTTSAAVQLMGEDTLPLGDCRVEWQGGHLKFDQEALWAEIDRTLGVPSASNQPAQNHEQEQ